MASKRREVRSKKDSTTSQMDSTITSLALCWLEAHAAHPVDAASCVAQSSQRQW
jgi:hypothetical protein